MLSKTDSDILFHLGYEWWMFRAMCDALEKIPDEPHSPFRNALVESMAVHGRALIAFFTFLDEKQKANVHPTDWIAESLERGLERVKRPSAIQTWHIAANKRVAHLTSDRLIPHTGWSYGPLRSFLTDEIEKIKKAFGTDFPKPWLGENNTALLDPTQLKIINKG